MKRPITNLVIGLLVFFSAHLAAQPTFSVAPQTITATAGSNITVDIVVSNFNNILSFQYSMNWDPAILQFQAPVTNITPSALPGMTGASFGLTQTGNGFLGVSWADPNASGVTVPNGTILYSLTFTLLTATPTTINFGGTPVPIEVYNGNGVDLTASTVFVGASVNGGSGGGGGGGGGGGNNPPVNGFAIIASDETAAPGTQICVDVTVNDFNNILSMQYTMEFNESRWSFVNIPPASFGLPGLTAASFGTNQTGQGLITFSWSDPNASGVTLANGTVIYQVCLNAIGPESCNTYTPFQFNSTSTPVEVYNGNSQPVNFQGISGDLEICSSGGGGGGGGGSTDLTFRAAEVESPAGSQICVDFTVDNFTCIVSSQFTIHFNQAITQYVSIQGFGLPDLNASNFGTTQTADGILRFSWASPDPVNGTTVANGTVIFQVCFNVIGTNGQVSNLTFDGNPLIVEVSSCNSSNVTPVFDSGSVTVGITCTGPVTITNPVTTNVSCAGQSNGGVAITVAGGSATKTYVWKNAAGTTVGSSQNLTGVPAGTYSVTVTSCGGQQTATGGPYTVTQPTALNLNHTSQDIACFGETNGAIDISVTGGTNTGTGCTGYTYAWSNGASTQDLTGLAAGNYTVTVTDCNACTIVSPTYIISAPTSALTATVTSTNVSCNGGTNGSITITATGGGNNKEYRLNTGTWVATNVFNNLGAGTYSAQVRDNFGCVKTNSVTVTQPDIIVVSLAATNPTQGQNNGSINTTVTGGVPPFTYSWTGPNGPIPGNPQNPTGLTAGTYCVTVTDANMCTKTKCGPVYAPMAENPSNPSTKKDACAGQCNGAIDVNVVGGVTPYIYAWTPSSIGNIKNPTGLCPGTYTVTVTSPSIGQTFTQTFTIAQPAQAPNAVAANLEVPTSSAGTNGSITLAVQGGAGAPYTYVWSGTTQTSNPIFGLGEGTYSTTITDANGCTGTAGPYVLDYVPPVLTTPQVNSFNACAGQGNGKIELTIFGGTPPYNYQISGPSNQSFVTGQNLYTFSNLMGGMYTYTITDSGAGVDQQSKTGTVTVATTTLSLSQTDITHATATSSGKINIEPAGGAAPYTFVWNTGATSEDLFNVAPDCYELTLKDANGCIQDFNNIGVGLLSANYTDDRPDCPQQLGSITAMPTLTPSCAVHNLPYSYSWKNTQGQTVGNAALLDNIVPGTYSVTITDSKGTSIVQTHELKALSSLSVSAEVTTDYNGYDIRCFGGSGGAAIALPQNGASPYTYIWKNASGATIGTAQAVSGLSAGINYSVTIGDQQGCTMTASVLLVGPPQLSADGTASASGCTPGNSGQATVTVSGGVPTYTYSWSNGSKEKTADKLTPGNTYAVTVTDFNGCTMIENVDVPDIVTLSAIGFSESDSGGPNGVAGVTVTGGTPPYKYVWKDYPTVEDSILTELFPGTYLVVITDANGCQVAKTIKVDDDTECGEVRTIITPEGDGKNEEFIIKCLSRFNDNTLEIYNRWGQLVYRTEDYNDDNLWRGTNTLGDDVPDGVYFYVFNYFDPGTNAFVTKKGSVTVLRK